MLKRFGLADSKGLREISEIVHEIDLKDNKFHRLEAAGLNAIIDGLSKVLSRRPQAVATGRYRF